MPPCPKINEACSGRRSDLVLVPQQIIYVTADVRFAMVIGVYGRNQTRTLGKRITEVMIGTKCS
jgi:hypothetical protein